MSNANEAKFSAMVLSHFGGNWNAMRDAIATLSGISEEQRAESLATIDRLTPKVTAPVDIFALLETQPSPVQAATPALCGARVIGGHTCRKSPGHSGHHAFNVSAVAASAAPVARKACLAWNHGAFPRCFSCGKAPSTVHLNASTIRKIVAAQGSDCANRLLAATTAGWAYTSSYRSDGSAVKGKAFAVTSATIAAVAGKLS